VQYNTKDNETLRKLQHNLPNTTLDLL